MKTLKLLIATTFLFVINSHGQLNKKNWMVGGTGSFNSYKQEQSFTWQSTGIESKTTYKNSDIEISAKVGYFVLDKLVLGITPTYSNFKQKSETASDNNTHKISIGPFARYYFLEKDKSFNILTEVNYQFGNLSISNQPDAKGKLDKFSLYVGPEIFFNSSVGMEFLLGYKTSTQKMNNPNYISYHENGFQVAFGLQIHLEKL